MKKILLFLIIACASITTAMSQQVMQRQTPEEKAKQSMEKMAPLNLDADAKAKVETIMLNFYSAQQEAMKEMRAGGNVNRDSAMAKRRQLMDTRDTQLKGVLKEDQYQKWKNEIEPSLRPQRVKN